MFIFWGTKVNRKNLGWVADFCPICRRVSKFRLVAVQSTSHVYYLSVGDGKLLGHEIVCEVCKIPLNADINHYPKVSKDSRCDLDRLVIETHPNVRERYGVRFDLEERLQKEGWLSAEERKALIQEPFLLLNPLVDVRATKTHFDRKSGITFLIAMLCLISAFLIFLLTPSSIQRILTRGLLFVSGVAAIWMIYYLITDPKRFAKDRIVPILLGALRPLQPKIGELEETLTFLASSGYKIGRTIKANQLFNGAKSGESKN